MNKYIYSVLILVVAFLTISSTVNSQSSTPGPVPPAVTTVSITNHTQNSAIYNGNVTADGGATVTARGFQRSLSASMGSPTTITSGSGTGIFNTTNSGLVCGTKYYIRAYARNSAGTSVGVRKDFTTHACSTPTPTPVPTPTPPTVGATPTSSNVKMTSARLESYVNGSRVTEWGFDYGTSPANLNFNSKRTYSMPSSSFAASILQDITGLNPNTKYYFRAYAKNAGGTTYSANISDFTTSQNINALNGWAWSSNIGWVSFNCANVSGTCTTSDYKVEIDLLTGFLTGYAWSSNIGWIKFGGLSDYPSSGTAAVPAKINMTNGNGEGWARACAGTVGGDCSSMNPRTDGWDGWIELAGTNHSADAMPTPTPSPAGYTGVRMNTTTGSITGMAWGSNVVGWLNFNASTDITSNFIASCTATNLGDDKILFTASATGGSGSYEYKWDTSTNYVPANTYTKSYTPGTTASIGVKLNVKDKSSGKTDDVACVGYPTKLTPIIVEEDPKCTITDPAPTNNKVSIFKDDSASFQIKNPKPADLDFRFIYKPANSELPPITSQTYKHNYTSIGTFDVYVKAIDNAGIYEPSEFYPCGQVEVKGRGLELQVAPDGTEAFTDVLTIKKGRNVKLMWMNSLDTTFSNPNRYTCLANSPSGAEWNAFAIADVNRNGVVPGLSTQTTGKHEFTISCRKFLTPDADPKTTSATLNVVSTTGSEI